MKKLPLTLAAAAVFLAGNATAQTKIYEGENGSFSTYGLLQIDVETYDGESKFQDQGSRLGFSGERSLNHGLTGFANLEFRFDANQKNEISSSGDGELSIRDTYFGFRGGFGELKIGNFDSIVFDLVTGQADIMENLGYRGLVIDETHAQGHSLAYTLPEFVEGLEIALAAKHYSSAKAGGNNPSADDEQQFNLQFAANYSLTEELSLGFGVDQNNDKAEAVWADDQNKTDPIFALSALYETDVFSLGLTVEKSGDYKLANLTGGVGLGASEVYFIASFADDGDESGVDFALGANYELGENTWVYAEVALGNDKNSDIQDADGKGTTAITLGAAYKW